MEFDEQMSRSLEARYSAPDIVGRRRTVMQALAVRTGERIVDVGSGPGLMAVELADAVGERGKVCGVDNSENMITLSSARGANRPWLEFRMADATALPYPDQSFDAAVCVQVLEFVKDVGAALSELCRVLRPGGRAVIVDTDWDSIVWHASDAGLMNRILRAWDEHVHDPHLPRSLSRKLRAAGFVLRQRSVINMFNPSYDENSISGGYIGVVSAFVPGRQSVSEDEVKLWASDLRALGEHGDYFFSLSQFMFLVSRPE
jgi:ubiquinone/menaquinone biosynthesis C-methylase UbiE